MEKDIMPVVSNDQWRKHNEGTDDVIEVDGAVTVVTERTANQGLVSTSYLLLGRVYTVITEVSYLPVKQLHT